MIVLDASAALDMLLNLAPGAAVVRQLVSQHRSAIFAPHLIDAEIAQVLRRYVLREEITSSDAAVIIDNWLRLPVTRVQHSALLRRAFELRDKLTAYDALYLALSEALGAVLITSDAAFTTVPGHNCRIELTR